MGIRNKYASCVPQNLHRAILILVEERLTCATALGNTDHLCKRHYMINKSMVKKKKEEEEIVKDSLSVYIRHIKCCL